MKHRKGIFIVAYAITKKGIEYILLKRKLHWRGWEFPKGGIEKFELKRRAVRRELFEETGLKPKEGQKSIKKLQYSGKYNYNKVFSDRPDIKGQTFQLYSVEVKKPISGKIKIDRLEHSEYKWCSYKQALKLLTWANQKKSLKAVNELLEENYK